VADCGTVEEDDPVTWETPAVLREDTGRRRPGEPLRRAAGSEWSGGRPVMVRSRAQNERSPPKVRHAEGRPEVELTQQGSRMAA
jgi:hypothetical protein